MVYTIPNEIEKQIKQYHEEVNTNIKTMSLNQFIECVILKGLNKVIDEIQELKRLSESDLTSEEH